MFKTGIHALGKKVIPNHDGRGIGEGEKKNPC